MARTKSKRSLGEEMIDDLTGLCEAMEQGQPLEKKYTVRTVTLDLKPQDYAPEDIKRIRRSLKVSQAVFAQILATSVECIESWEQGTRRPPPMARRLLDLISRHRDQWIRILEDARKRAV